MSLVLITGSSGLVGSESVNFFSDKGFDVVGIDNNLRKFFFGNDGSTHRIKNSLLKKNKRFKHYSTDIRNYLALEKIFNRFYTERPIGEKFGNHSGLGLSISKQIIEAHNGNIEAFNRFDQKKKCIGATVKTIFKAFDK